MDFQPGPTTLNQAIEALFEYPDYLGLAKRTKENKRQSLDFLKSAATHRGDTLVGMLTYDDFTRALQISAEPGSPEENMRRKALGKQPKRARSSVVVSQDKVNLRKFAEFLVFKGWVQAGFNPLPRFTKSSRPKGNDKPTPEHTIIKEQDYERLLGAAQKRHMRNRMTIALGLWSGRRVSEAVRLTWGDLDLGDDPSMTFTNVKRGRRAQVPLLDELVLEIQNYKVWFESMYGPVQPHWFLLPAKFKYSDPWPITDYFYWADGERKVQKVSGAFIKARTKVEPSFWPMKLEQQAREESLNDDVDNALKDAGILNVYRPGMHILRHSLAEWLHRIDPTGRLAQVLLDHESLQTTLKAYSSYGEQLKRTKALLRARKPEASPPVVSGPELETPNVSQSATGQSQRSNVISLAGRRRRAG